MVAFFVENHGRIFLLRKKTSLSDKTLYFESFRNDKKDLAVKTLEKKKNQSLGKKETKLSTF